MSKHENKKVNSSSWHGFTKGKSSLTNLIAFCDKTIGLVNGGRQVDVVYLSFIRAFNIVANKVRKYRLDKWTVR